MKVCESIGSAGGSGGGQRRLGEENSNGMRQESWNERGQGDKRTEENVWTNVKGRGGKETEQR